MTTLTNFGGEEGRHPLGLTLATDGYLYGVTDGDGFWATQPPTAFRMSAHGQTVKIADFSAIGIGVNRLLQASDGNL